jgi:hypothetical protein
VCGAEWKRSLHIPLSRKAVCACGHATLPFTQLLRAYTHARPIQFAQCCTKVWCFDRKVIARDGMQRLKVDQLELPQSPSPNSSSTMSIESHQSYHHPNPFGPISSSIRLRLTTLLQMYSAARASLPELPLLSIDHTPC